MEKADFVVTLTDGAGNPSKVTVAFTMALNALRKGHSVLMVLMLEAVHLARPGAGEGMAIGAPFEPVPALLASFLAGGGRLAACQSCLVHEGLGAKDLDPRHAVITAGDVIDLLVAAKGSLQMN